jgi:hypothetical protein
MNKRIDFSFLGGYPLAEQDLEWLQDSYRDAFAAIAGLCGDATIIMGMQEAAGNVTAGWISLNGELIPFLPGSIGTGEFTIQETSTSLVFEDGTTHNVLFEKVAVFSAGGTYNYNNLKRIEALKFGLVPRGAIVMWSGAIVAIPATWQLCDGTNGTPNLSGQFIAGYNVADVDYNVIGNTGGHKEFTVTQNNIQQFTISKPGSETTGGVGNPVAGNGSADGTVQYTVGSASPTPINNRPPYYTLAYIIKL